ncbi:cytochrome c biogenesis protein CcdA [Mucilaginibacter sp. KACC 22773]|uniref:protein-disulfide reductase DsbD family protein n=1 Tax=Mucilaginibacter sp. KACC 22773 TaxID=3025671 RepID=UPI0023666ADE|nr:cytochrome c biogenesis protein CcdA [Mucilaginibacter sp. KACC 22773]WDF77181.1 cytochrome c biogenesis protein CcdA [Mucilaginibacter sp. KACC 22773]
MSYIKRIFLTLLILTGLSISGMPASAQDTISTAGVVFAPAPADTPKPQVSLVKNPVKKPVNAPDKKEKKKTLLAIFLAGVLGGFAALLMPCIFPMLPMTVSYFTKGADRSRGISKAITYGVAIIVIYVVLGLLITVCFGPDALNSLSTNGVFNFAFFLLLVAFAASFLGAFEITLPSKWVNKMDQESDRKGLAGIFFMAATLALVSFSCTGPIIGTLLVQAATTGALLGPAIGMFGFALALALPFALFAMFPSWLNALPKSGGWLNSVKVTLGFLELALSLKFLSNVDLAYHWHWFDREIFLVLWIVIFALMGIYLLGKLTLSHDSELKFVSVPRLFLAIIVLSFTMYLVPGLWGAPLKSVSAFLPPKATQDFDLSGGLAAAVNTVSDNGPHKYEGLFDKPKGFNPFFDYAEGLAYAKKVHKPVMIDFTGHACVNCRKMEENVWPDPKISKLINQDYVLIQLYVDDKTDLSADEQTTTPEGRSIKTIGNKWSYLQTSKFGANSQPFYVLLDPGTEQPMVDPKGAEYDIPSYQQYLESGLNAFKR